MIIWGPGIYTYIYICIYIIYIHQLQCVSGIDFPKRHAKHGAMALVPVLEMSCCSKQRGARQSKPLSEDFVRGFPRSTRPGGKWPAVAQAFTASAAALMPRESSDELGLLTKEAHIWTKGKIRWMVAKSNSHHLETMVETMVGWYLQGNQHSRVS